MLGNMSLGGMSTQIGAAIAIAIAAIVLLTVAPGIVGDIDQIYLTSQRTCLFGSERVTRLSPAYTGSATAEATWNAATASTVKTLNIPSTNGTACTITSGASGNTYYTPGGQSVTEGGSGAITAPSNVVTAPSFESLNALGGGSLVQLLFGALAIMLPIGSIAFLGYLGGNLANQQIGGNNGMAVAIAAAVATAVVAAILPSVFAPLDSFYNSLDGIRYAVYATGIGQLAQVLGDFLAVALIAGIIVLGGLLWKGQKGDGGMNGGGGGNQGRGGF